MTGYESKKAAASAKTIDEVNWADHEPNGLAQPEQEPQICCGEYDTCLRACTPRGRHLAQPEQELVQFEAWLAKQHGDPEEIGFLQALRIAYIAGQDSITTPPQRTWVGLTEQDKWEILLATERHDRDDVMEMTEAKLKEKNT